MTSTSGYPRVMTRIWCWVLKMQTSILTSGTNVLPTIIRDKSVIDSLKKRSAERLRGAIVFASVWDGVGSAALPSLISKFNRQSIDSLSIAVLPSKIQPADAHFNAYATLQMCMATEGSTVVLLGRDQLETFEGVDKSGVQIKGNSVVNYMLNMFLAKESLVQEISELSRTFNVKLFSAISSYSSQLPRVWFNREYARHCPAKTTFNL